MIADPERLRELIDEIAEHDLSWRRQFVADIETAYGEAAAGQIKEALKEFWRNRE